MWMSLNGKTAVCVGATSGIGRAIATHLAARRATIVAIGRNEEAGRTLLEECRMANPDGEHKFFAVDCMVMSEIADFVHSKDKMPSKVNYLVQSQGIASVAGRTETVEGIDRKLAVHYYGRVLFTKLMLPHLKLAKDSGEDAVMLSILSAGVHGAYTDVKDLGLKQNFSIKNAADAAGFYNDLALDHLSLSNDFHGIALQHAAPGVVATAWGSEFPWFLRYPVRAAQFLFGKAPEACARTMVDAMLSPKRLKGGAVHLFGETGLDAKFNAAHTPEIRAAVWAHTDKVLDAALKVKSKSKSQPTSTDK